VEAIAVPGRRRVCLAHRAQDRRTPGGVRPVVGDEKAFDHVSWIGIGWTQASFAVIGSGRSIVGVRWEGRGSVA
jgi:hypothetical protein